MTASAHTKLTLDAYMKDVYDNEKLEFMVPDYGILYKLIAFSNAKKVGRDFVKPIQLTREGGFTYGAGMQTLNGIVTSDGDDAKVRGSALTLQSGWSYDAASAMAAGTKASFVDATAFRFKAMMESAVYRLELQALYGNSGLGIADSSQDSVTAVTDTDKAIIPITAASWSAGIWSGAEGQYVSLFTTAANAASAAEGNDASNTVNKFQITAVDPVTKSITVATKDATEAAALVVEVEAADYNIFWYGARTNEMTGLETIVQNTGTLYGISGATYSMWKGNSSNVSSARLTLSKIFVGVSQAVGRGLLEDVTLLVSPYTYATLANDEAALRQYTAKVGKADRGVDSIEFQGPNGRIAVLPHPLCKDTIAMAFPTKKAERIGSTDLTFKRPGSDADMVMESPTQTGYEVRLFSDQSIFLPCPSKCVYFYGISNSSAT